MSAVQAIAEGWQKPLRGILPVVCDLAVLSALVWVVYVHRLPELPLAGEEPRRAEVAREMLRTGDFLVPRQQGEVYTSRPPLQNWLIAALAYLRGSWDAWTVRLPSVLATCALTLGVYVYTAWQVGRLAALGAGAIFLTMGQVMQLGGLAETDAVFALFLASALFVWHGTVHAQRWPWLGSLLAGVLAGLAGLTKGAQGPIWFFGVIGVWTLSLWLINGFSLTNLAAVFVSLAACTASLAAWTVPYLWAVGPENAWRIWFGQIEARLSFVNFYQHLLLRPLETLACWLPWTPLLVVYFSRRFWQKLSPSHRWLAVSWLLALGVTFPMIWLLPEARNRYFLPLYPAVAVLMGIVVDYAGRQEPSWLFRYWMRYVEAYGLVVVGGGLVAVGLLLAARWMPVPVGWDVRTVLLFTAVLAAFWVVAEMVQVYLQGAEEERPDVARDVPRISVPTAVATTLASMALVAGIAYKAFIYSTQVSLAHDPTLQVATIRRLLPEPDKLVSFGPVFHRFRFCYGLPIRLLPVPQSPEDVPNDVNFFCLEGQLYRTGNKSPQESSGGKLTPFGRIVSSSGSGDALPKQPAESKLILETFDGNRLEAPALPFDWELLAIVPCGRNRNEKVQPAILVGRISRATGLMAQAESPNKPSQENPAPR